MRTAPVLARTARLLAALAQTLFVVLGVLIPFTAGVSVVLLPVPMAALAIAFLLARAARPHLTPADPAYASLERTLALARRAGVIGLVALALLVVSILVGVLLYAFGVVPRRP